jgi:hypothetical protein
MSRTYPAIQLFITHSGRLWSNIMSWMSGRSRSSTRSGLVTRQTGISIHVRPPRRRELRGRRTHRNPGVPHHHGWAIGQDRLALDRMIDQIVTISCWVIGVTIWFPWGARTERAGAALGLVRLRRAAVRIRYLRRLPDRRTCVSSGVPSCLVAFARPVIGCALRVGRWFRLSLSRW